MIKSILSVLLLIVCGEIAASNDSAVSKEICKVIDAEIKTVNNQLRRGYSVKEGESLKATLRELKEQKRACRLNGYSTK